MVIILASYSGSWWVGNEANFVIVLLAHHMSPPCVGALSPGRERGVGSARRKPISSDIPTVSLDLFRTFPSFSACMTQCVIVFFLQSNPGG